MTLPTYLSACIQLVTCANWIVSARALECLDGKTWMMMITSSKSSSFFAGLVAPSLSFSVTRLSDFYKVSSDQVSSKSSHTLRWLFGLKWKTSLLGKNCCSYFWGNFRKYLGYFYFDIWSHCWVLLFLRLCCCCCFFERLKQLIFSVLFAFN